MRGESMTAVREAGVAGERRIYLPEGELLYTRENREALASPDSLREAMRRGTVLEAPCILCDGETMELTLDLGGGRRGVIPREEAVFSPTGEPVRDIAVLTRVGRPVQFCVIGFREEGEDFRAVCSRRLVGRDCWEERLSRLVPGDVLGVRVTHMESFGAFCDAGAGIPALLPVDRVSVSRVRHPSERFRVGERIPCAVLSRTEEGRIYLTHREFLGTWEENARNFAPGQTVRGIIRSVEDYGVFVELAPNLCGLAEPTPGAEEGHRCAVYIKSILPERMKVKLAIVEVGAPVCAACGGEERERFPRPDREGHIDLWRYSPEGCRKTVETDFREKENSEK